MTILRKLRLWILKKLKGIPQENIITPTIVYTKPQVITIKAKFLTPDPLLDNPSLLQDHLNSQLLSELAKTNLITYQYAYNPETFLYQATASIEVIKH